MPPKPDTWVRMNDGAHASPVCAWVTGFLAALSGAVLDYKPPEPGTKPAAAYVRGAMAGASARGRLLAKGTKG